MTTARKHQLKANVSFKRPPLAKYQTDILDSPARYTVTEASTKAGKTASHMIWLFEQAWAGREGMNFWWVAPVFSQAKIAFNRFKTQLVFDAKNRGKSKGAGIGYQQFYKENKSELTLTLPNGAIIWFKSADNPDSLFGEDVYASVFDEYSRAKEEAWFALRSTLTATRGRCKFIGNVKGKGNWGYKLALKAKQSKNKKEFAYFKITAYDAVDAGILDLAEVEQAKQDLPDHVFKALYLAEASDDGVNPFGDKFIELCIKPLSTLPPVCYGIDLAKSVDYTVIIGLDSYGDVCYFDRFQADWGATKRKIVDLGYLPMCIDSTGVGDPVVEDVQRELVANLVEGFKFSQSSKQQLMEGLAVAIQRGEIGFPSGEIEEELQIFEYQYTRTGVRYAAPEGLHDDCVMALGLAWRKYKEVVINQMPMLPIAGGRA